MATCKLSVLGQPLLYWASIVLSALLVWHGVPQRLIWKVQGTRGSLVTTNLNQELHVETWLAIYTHIHTDTHTQRKMG